MGMLSKAEERAPTFYEQILLSVIAAGFGKRKVRPGTSSPMQKNGWANRSDGVKFLRK